MKILNIYRQPPDPVTRELAEILAKDREAREFSLYQEPVDYNELLTLILSHDQVISWW